MPQANGGRKNQKSRDRSKNYSNASTTEYGGIFTLGALQNDSFVNGTLNFVDVPSSLASYWLIPLDGVNYNGSAVPDLGTVNAAIDTGTTLIGGPQAFVSSLYQRIPGAQSAGGNYAGY